MIVPRLQTYLREKACYQGRERLNIPPFTVFYNPAINHPSEGIAFPDEFIPILGYSAADVGAMCAAFERRGRVPYVQFLDAFAPGLPITLQLGLHPFQEKARLPVLVCTSGTLVYPPDVDGLEFMLISSDSPLRDLKDHWNVNSRGFDPLPSQATDEAAEVFRQKLGKTWAFNARLDGESVGVGMLTEVREGVTELVGITTLEGYRRQGIGAALTAYITRTAFDAGAEYAFLIAASEGARRVYESVGFRHMANLLEYESLEGGSI